MRCKHLALLLALTGFPFSIAHSDCPPTLSWSLAWAGQGKSSEVFYSVAADISGGAVAAGYEVRNDLKQGKNWLLVAYDKNGKVAWSTSYDDPSHGDDAAQSVTVDSMGNIVAAGWEERRDRASFADVLVRRMGPGGELFWSREYDGPAHGNDRAYAVAVELSGSMVVAGMESTRGGSNWLVLKYDAKGTLMWARTCGGKPGLTAAARAVAVDPAGGIVVAGSEQVGGFNHDWTVRKFDDSGIVVWTLTMAGAGGGWDEAHALAPYVDGGVLVAGKVQQGGPGSPYSWQVMRLSPSGEVKWTRTGPGDFVSDTRAMAAAVDGCGRAVVAGTAGSFSRTGSGLGTVLYSEYGQDGDLVCTWTGTGSASPFGAVLGAGMDRVGDVYLVGSGLAGPGGRDLKAFITRLERASCPDFPVGGAPGPVRK